MQAGTEVVWEDAPPSKRGNRTMRDSPLLFFCLVLVGTACDDSTGIADNYSYQAPPQTNDGWQTASLGDAGMDTAAFVDLMNGLVHRNDDDVHGIVVARGGRLVFEEYLSGEDLDLSNLSDGIAFTYEEFDRNSLHCLASDTKSVTSLLLGIAIDQGLIAGTDETMFSFLPEYANLSDATKAQITLADMLAMASGLPWNEDYPFDDIRNDLTAMVFSEDPIAYVLGKSTVAAPGAQFIYNSGTTNLLGEVVSRASDVTLWAFAEQSTYLAHSRSTPTRGTRFPTRRTWPWLPRRSTSAPETWRRSARHIWTAGLGEGAASCRKAGLPDLPTRSSMYPPRRTRCRTTCTAMAGSGGWEPSPRERPVSTRRRDGVASSSSSFPTMRWWWSSRPANSSIRRMTSCSGSWTITFCRLCDESFVPSPMYLTVERHHPWRMT